MDDIELKKVEVEVAEDEEEDEVDPCMSLDDPEFKTPKISTYRQQSVTVRAKQRWGQVKRAMVDDRAQTKKEVTEKWVNLTRSMSTGVSEFFGVSGGETDTDKVKEKWKARSRRLHHNTLIGGNKKEADSMDNSQVTSPHLSYIGTNEDQHETGSPSLKWNRKIPRPVDPLSMMHSRQASRQASRISTASSGRRTLRTEVSRRGQKDSVLKMTMDGVKYLARGISKPGEKSPFVRSRSFAPSVRQSAGVVDEHYLNDVFFNTPAPTSAAIRQKPFFPPGPGASVLPYIHEKSESEPPEPPTPSSDGVFNSLDSMDGMSPMTYINTQIMGIPPPEKKPLMVEIPKAGQARKPEEPSKMFSGMRRVADKVIDATFDNSIRRQYGVGVVGVWLDRDYRKSRIDSRVEKQMAEMDDHRPYFTYWVTFVQVVIFIFTLCVYEPTYFGFEIEEVKREVLRTSLSKEQCSYDEPQNMWYGPRQADLIHLGAKYSPCMRPDVNVELELQKEREKERRTACCILNDGSGCFQASESDCSMTLSLWDKSNASGRVCGQDPRYCKEGLLPNRFPPDDITLWPVCDNPGNGTKADRHLTCDIIGRPCCVGIHGQCIITTREHCEFVRGFFHQEATLCSQVPCLNEVCGMIPFWNSSVPNQFYRLWTSLFLHAGAIQLLITVAFQIIVMRDLEKLAGWIRISIIYMISGIAGSLSSAIFLPYHVEAGPTGSQFGLLACLFVEVIQSWQMLQHPLWAIGKLIILLVFLFIVGLFPWIDNYAHLIGFIFGFLLSFALFPHVTFNVIDERGKRIGIVVCLIASVSLLIGLFIMFYVSPIYSCEYCKFFNCIPFTDRFCSSMEVNISFAIY